MTERTFSMVPIGIAKSVVKNGVSLEAQAVLFHIWTTSSTSFCGAFEYSASMISSETGLSNADVVRLLEELAETGDILWCPKTDFVSPRGWAAANVPKNQSCALKRLREICDNRLIPKEIQLPVFVDLLCEVLCEWKNWKRDCQSFELLMNLVVRKVDLFAEKYGDEFAEIIVTKVGNHNGVGESDFSVLGNRLAALLHKRSHPSIYEGEDGALASVQLTSHEMETRVAQVSGIGETRARQVSNSREAPVPHVVSTSQTPVGYVANREEKRKEKEEKEYSLGAINLLSKNCPANPQESQSLQGKLDLKSIDESNPDEFMAI